MGKRINWIDNARGICTFFFLMAHCTISPQLYNFIYTPFFLMLFFFISGFLFSTEISIKQHLKKLIKGLIIPYFLLNIIIIITGIDNWNAILNHNWPYIINKLYDIILGYDLWFVSCLIIVQIFYIILTSISQKPQYKLLIGILFLPTVYLIRNTNSFILPWYIDTASFALSFYSFGNYFKDLYKTDNNIHSFLSGKKKSICLLIGYIITAICMQIYLPMEFHVAYNYYESPIYFIILAVIGIITIVCVSINFPLKYFIELGKNSLTVFAFNGKALAITLILTRPLNLISQNPYYSSIIICLIQSIILLFIGKLINKYIPFIVGKNKSNK